ncbi:MAG: hypothetical protein ACLFR2_00250 [Candidatus Kapaibacterium sp.]
MLRMLLLIFAGLLITSSLVKAQNDEIEKKENEWGNRWDMEFWEPDLVIKFDRPVIELNYAITQNDIYENFGSKFSEDGLAEIRLGFKDKYQLDTLNPIFKFNFGGLLLSNITNKMAVESADNREIKVDMWRLGFFSNDGFGYGVRSSVALNLYHGGSIFWTSFDYKGLPDGSLTTPADSADKLRLERYSEGIRYADSFEAGMNIVIANSVSINAAYERGVLYERYIFWYWAGNVLIEEIAHALTDSFINEIRKASPMAVPVVNFVLKNALSYGIYELKKSKMNWPFNSASPYMINNFKLGVQVLF